jgi:hypothetical protein
MRCAQFFNLSHWTPQLVEYLLCIAPATARVPYKQAKNTIKTNASHLLAILMAKAMRWYGTKHINSRSALQLKPLDTAISQIFTPYRPSDRQGPIQTYKRTQSNNKTKEVTVQDRGGQGMTHSSSLSGSGTHSGSSTAVDAKEEVPLLWMTTGVSVVPLHFVQFEVISILVRHLKL